MPYCIRTTALLLLLATCQLHAQTTIVGAEALGGAVDPVIINIDPASLPAAAQWLPGDPIREIPMRQEKNFNPPPREPRGFELDPLLDRQLQATRNALGGDAGFNTLLVNRAGTNFTGVNPSDTVGDIGNDYYVQLVNTGSGNGSTRVLILNKADGTLAIPAFNLADMAVGSGTGCTSGAGDPIVNFDETADNGPGNLPGRWVLSEFTNSSFCLYISQTADPTSGQWFLYEFISETGGLPDYPKFGVWPDAYYIGANEGPRQYALDRINMLAGITARGLQVFQGTALPGFGFQHIMPVDWDGDSAPAPGSPGLFMRHRDTEIHGPGGLPTSDIIEMFEFVADFDNAANSTFTGPINVAVSEFDSEFCNLVFSGCLTQPGSSTTLFALLQPIMWRAQYRSFSDRQSIVANMTTDVDGNDIGGVRWFELTNTGSGWSLAQDGTVSENDGISRWMASVAQDEAGNIVAGYNVVGVGAAGTADDVFPGMRYNGRLVSDPPGTMPQGEVSIIEGAAPNNSIRYGDYTSLNVDPVDGCTFWYTAQHNQTNQWSTQIGSFRFDACGEPGFTLSASNAQQQVCIPDDLQDIDINVGSVADFINPVTLSLQSPPTGVSGSFSTNPVVPGNSSIASISIDSSAALGDNLITLLGTAAGADDRSTTVLATVYNVLPASPVLNTPGNNASNTVFRPVFSWNGDNANSFVLDLATDPDFNNVVFTTTVTESTATVAADLDSNTQYYWRVRASNACGSSTVSQTFTFTTMPAPGDCPIGVPAITLFEDDVENGDNGWTHTGTQDTWQRSGLEANSGSFAWFAEDLASVSDQLLVSPAVALPVGQLPMILSYQNSQTLEDNNGTACWDAGLLEISTNDGLDWTQIPSAALLTDPYDGVVSNSTNPISGLSAWCADPEDFVRSIVDLSAYQGETVRFRFRLGTDGSVGRANDGWFIDDIKVQSCQPPETILMDGFEDPAP